MRTLIIRLKEEKDYNRYTMEISKEFLPDFQKLITKWADEDVFVDIKIENDDIR